MSSSTQKPRRRAAEQQGPCSKEHRRIFSCKGRMKGERVDVTTLGILPPRHTGADPLPVAKRHLQHLRKMQAAAVGGLQDLFTTTEPICENQGLFRRFAYLGQQHQLTDLYRHIIVIAVLEPERAGHTATS